MARVVRPHHHLFLAGVTVLILAGPAALLGVSGGPRSRAPVQRQGGVSQPPQVLTGEGPWKVPVHSSSEAVEGGGTVSIAIDLTTRRVSGRSSGSLHVFRSFMAAGHPLRDVVYDLSRTFAGTLDANGRGFRAHFAGFEPDAPPFALNAPLGSPRNLIAIALSDPIVGVIENGVASGGFFHGMFSTGEIGGTLDFSIKLSGGPAGKPVVKPSTAAPPAAPGTLFPATMSCRVVDVEGHPLEGVHVGYGEHRKGDAPNAPSASAKLVTDRNGLVSVSVRKRDSESVKFGVSERSRFEFHSAPVERSRDNAASDCTIVLLSGDAFANLLRTEMFDLFAKTCLPRGDIEGIKSAKITTEPAYEGQTASVYLSNDQTLHVLPRLLDGEWPEARREGFHEFSHWISDHLIDPGKKTRGTHNNWVATGDSLSPVIDGRQTAFEEGAADFIAYLYFKAKGEDYQRDLNQQVAVASLQQPVNVGRADRVEGAVTAFLLDYYKKEIDKGPQGIANVLSDFVSTIKRRAGPGPVRLLGASPARTIREFIASKASALAKGEQACGVPLDEGGRDALNALIGVYGFEDGLPFCQLTTTDDAALARFAAENGIDRTVLAPGTFAPTPGKRYAIPVNTGEVSVVTPSHEALMRGKIPTARFKNDVPAGFTVSPDGRVRIDQGAAVVTDGPVDAGPVHVNDDGTEYLVEVTSERTTVTVADGRVTLSAGAAKVVLDAGESSTYEHGAFAATPSPSRAEGADAVPPGSSLRPPPASDASWAADRRLLYIGIVAIAAVALVVVVLSRRRKPVPVDVLALGQTHTLTEAGHAARVHAISTPDGAEIWVDGKFVGQTPSMLRLSAGHHEVVMSLSGYQTWRRQIAIGDDADLTLKVAFETERA
jgi:hypothetical protein